MSNFYSLPIKNIKKLTAESVCIRFDISEIEDGKYDFKSGQYITIEHTIGGESIRRSYSISSSPKNGVEIGVKLVENGLMSTFLTRELKVDDILQVMPPTGNFILDVDSKNSNKYVGICSGSGITPILSMITNVLNNEPLSSFELIYGNKSQSSVMFNDEISSLLNRFPDRFILHSLFSRENIEGVIKGRIDEYSLKKIFDDNSSLLSSNEYFICGPGNMIDNVKNFLDLNAIEASKVNFELFSSPDSAEINNDKAVNEEIISNITVCVDGDDFEFELSSNGATILDAAIEAGADVPFSCKGGVCSVCKAKVMEGSASMDMNYSLAEDDVEEGFILTCQAHPTSANIFVDYDEM